MTTDSNAASPSDDAIARLLKEAGSRPGVDRERSQRVHAAVREQWVEATRARRRRRNIFRGLSAVATAAGILVAVRFGLREPTSPTLTLPSTAVVAVGVVETVSGPLRSNDSLATTGDTVFTGAVLTTDAHARAAVRLASGASLRLDVATRVLVESPETFMLESGAVYIDSGDVDVALAVRTTVGLARDVGTQFEVRLRDGAMVVRVREGFVELARDEHLHEASAGDELRILGDGVVERATVLPYAPQWDWVAQTAPPFRLEGSSLRSFLDWVTREQGWTPRFEDAALEASADTIQLEGPILDVAPGAALRTVLPACGLTHRIENGQLWIVDAH